MPSIIRALRISAIITGALLLWGATAACETDSLSKRRIETAPSYAMSAEGVLPGLPGADRTESDLAQEMILHRAMYARYLHVLADYYSSHGYENKARWARIELRDLRNVRLYCVTSSGAVVASDRKSSVLEDPPGTDLPSISLDSRSELDLVEEMILHRDMYGRNLTLLGRYYAEHGQENKANLVRTELNDRQVIKVYRYITEAEAPGAPLRPLESIAAADRLFQQGQDLMDKGGHHVIIWYNNETMKRALNKFKDLVDRYPTSDKIDDAAYFIAEIHKEYNQERNNEIAIEWYTKAIAWNPDLPYPAWSHTAHIYDFRMHEREKALEWYQKVLEHEKGKRGWRFAKNIDVANKRIGELTTEKTRYSPAELAGQPAPAPGSPPPPGGAGTAASPKPPAEP